MRLLLIFIVLLNLLYAGWHYLQPARSGNGIPPMADNLKRLELLREAPSVNGQANNEITGQAEQQPSVVDVEAEDSNEDTDLVLEAPELEQISSKQACYTLGPFKDKIIMQQLRESLAEHVSNLEVRKRKESEKHRYWVYMPRLASRKEAKLMANKLRENKVSDFYIVLSGESRNSISLGHFREPSHANRRVKQITQLGFEAEINVIYRDYDVYWLDYETKDSESDSGFAIEEYMTEGVSRLARECVSLQKE